MCDLDGLGLSTICRGELLAGSVADEAACCCTATVQYLVRYVIRYSYLVVLGDYLCYVLTLYLYLLAELNIA